MTEFELGSCCSVNDQIFTIQVTEGKEVNKPNKEDEIISMLSPLFRASRDLHLKEAVRKVIHSTV